MKKYQLKEIIREVVVEEFMIENLINEVLQESAKWRSSSVAQRVTDPDDDDPESYDYHAENPRSTGMLRAKSDTAPTDGSLNRRRPGQIATRGPNTGKLSAKSAETLKSRIRSNVGPTIKNPKTGRTILAKTALSAGPAHPAYKIAKSAMKKEITEYLNNM
jgi:hypothetical protein